MSYDSTEDELEFFSKFHIAEAETLPSIVTLVGPIRFWWGDNWNKYAHRRYVRFRDDLRLALVTQPNIAVYSPHRAIQGAWHPLLQQINDTAIRMSDVLVDLTPSPDWFLVDDGEAMQPVTAEGTAEECIMAMNLGIPVVRAQHCCMVVNCLVDRVLTTIKNMR